MKYYNMAKKITKDKAIDIKGKDYILVKDRVLFFNEEYINGSIATELVSEPTAEMVVIKAIVTPDVENPTRIFTGYSQATWGEGMVNKTAAIENCETSAIGRALGAMGIGVLDSIASADEMRKTEYANPSEPASEKQLNAICISLKKLGVSEENCMDTELKIGNNLIKVKDLNKRQGTMLMGMIFDKADKGQKFKELVFGLDEFDPNEKVPEMSPEEMIGKDIF